MNRRLFIGSCLGGAASHLPISSYRTPRTKRLVLIINSGARKKEYYEAKTLSPNIAQLASQGLVFEEDHCANVASHEAAFVALTHQIPPFSYTTSIEQIPAVMQQR